MALAKAEPSARIADNHGPYVASTGSAVNGLSTESMSEATTVAAALSLWGRIWA